MNKYKFWFLSISILVISLITYVKLNTMNINDIGLKVLSWVKNVRGEGVDLTTFKDKKTNPITHESWTALLCYPYRIPWSFSSFSRKKSP